MTIPTSLSALLASIRPRSAASYQAARARLDALCKPPGSLGKLEDLAATLSGITGEAYPAFPKKAIIIVAADNGVVAEGVASADPAFTRTQTENFIRGVTGVAVLARRAGADLIAADVGINCDPLPPPIRNLKIARGTKNFCHAPAMTREEALAALMAGVTLAKDAKATGYQLLGAGEMGIGNTTTSTAVLCALLQKSPAELTGRGAGLSNEAYARKQTVIAHGLARHQPDPEDPLDIVSKVGGFDLAALMGLYLGAAAEGLPIVVDGFISATAALLAVRLCPTVRDYLLPSHKSAEPGFAALTQALNLTPGLDLDMRLGEGSGCPLAFFLCDCACDLLRDMATLEEANVGARYLSALSTFSESEDPA